MCRASWRIEYQSRLFTLICVSAAIEGVDYSEDLVRLMESLGRIRASGSQMFYCRLIVVGEKLLVNSQPSEGLGHRVVIVVVHCCNGGGGQSRRRRKLIKVGKEAGGWVREFR